MSRIAVLGAGAMGGAAAVLLARHDDVELLVLDVDGERAERVAERAGARGRGFDPATGELVEGLAEVEAVCACIPYRVNLPTMEAALAAGCHYADLGGLFHVTLQQLELHERFERAGLSAVLGIGSAPGITNVLARLGADRLDAGSVRAIDMVDGAAVARTSDGGIWLADGAAPEQIGSLGTPAPAFEPELPYFYGDGVCAVEWPALLRLADRKYPGFRD